MVLPAYCHGLCEYQQSSATPHIEGLNPEPAYIGELAHVETHLRQLHGVHADLLHHYNHHHSYIYTLPLEVLGDIFLHTCTFGRNSWEEFGAPTGQATILSSVSSHWRWVALNTPKLWSTVTFDIRGRTLEIKAALLRHHLKYGIDLDISMHLSTTVSVLSGSSPITRIIHALQFQTIADILFAPENVQKVTSLRIESPPTEWLAKLSWLPRIHTLVLNSLHGRHNMPVALNLHNQPLCRVKLSFDSHTYVCGSLNLPSSVQELFTSRLRHDVMLRFLYQCPGLTKVRALKFSGEPQSSSRSFSTTATTRFTPFNLGHLEDLTWPAGDWLHPIQRLSLPALKHLRLEDPWEDFFRYISSRGGPEPIITFCRQFSDTLVSLELTGSIGLATQTFERLLVHNAPHLEVLYLVGWPYGSLIRAVEILTPSKEEFYRHEIKFLPRLRSLALQVNFAYESTDDPDDSGPDLNRVQNARCIAKVSLKMLERRRAGQVEPFFLDLPCLRYGWIDKKYVWSVNLRDSFRQFVKGRRYLDIRQESEILEWLYN